jgi:hypothetical protein
MDDAVGYLLDALKQFKAREPEILTAIRVGSPVELEFACRLNKLLNERVDLTLDNLALADFVELLRHKSKLPIRLDQRTLDDAGITLTDSRVSLELRQVPLRVAIALALAPLKLTTYFEFEQIWISTVEAGETKTHLEVYPVLDFLPTEDKHADRSIRSLVDPLTRHLLPESWAERGGPCNVMCYYPLRCLVVSQTELGHAEVANYLQALRKARSMPPQPATLPAPPPTSSR